MLKKLTISKITEYLFYFYIFLLPWQTRYIWRQGYIGGGKWEYGTFSLYGTEIIFYIILILVGYNIYSKKEKLLPKNKKIPVLFWMISLLELIAFISIFYAPDMKIAVYGWLKLLQGMLLFFVILKINFKFEKLCAFLIASGFIQAILGFIQFWYKKQPGIKWLGLPELDASVLGVSVIEYVTYVEKLGTPFAHRWLRVHGSLPHPNIAGFFLVLTLAACLAVYLSKQYGMKKLVPILASLIIIPAFVMTFSRSSWLSFVIILLIFWIIILLKSKKTEEKAEEKKDTKFGMFKFTLIFILFTSVIVLIYPHLFETRFTEGSRLEKRSNLERMSGLSQSMGIISQNWYKGVGINNYTKVLSKEMEPKLIKELKLLEQERKSYDYQPVHNLYLLIFSELGLSGIIVFCLILLIIIKDIFRHYNYLFTDYYFLGVTSVFIAMLSVSLFDHYLWSLYVGIMMFWMVIGLLYKKINTFK